MGFLSKALGSASGSFKTVQSGLVDPAKKGFGIDQPIDYDLAKHGIRWKVADAKKAGIHPLYALGAQATAGGVSNSGNLIGDIASLGSDISRAIQATRSQSEREDAYSEAFKQQQYERNNLENDLLRAQIAKTSQVGPPLPSAMDPAGTLPGQSPEYRVNPVDIPASQPGRPSQLGGAQPETSWMRFPGGYQPVPNQEALEDADIGNPAALAWYWRNFIIPNFTGRGNRPRSSMSPTGKWRWSRANQGWVPDTGSKPFYEYNWSDAYDYGKRKWNYRSPRRGRGQFGN